ncbi:uncharacterized protein LOC110463579 [Mizuhopecten yessoensis]|uniref:Profilin n=1 Tax=Mizuhopecten yessoensis TaxID=6573 RepID=A0A210PVW6_MIZYE|nr:uncharacterized protein LOC110463579 [Mizuhopecten yessoensis]OWF40605.1 hypothetical protein KP79_PYT04482 [Mizuhopecten yessoensis]
MTDATWQPWADNVLIQPKGNAVFHAAIFGLDGALWGRSSNDNRCPTPQEGVALAYVLSSNDKREAALQNGVHYCNCKFNVIFAENGEVKAVKGAKEHCPAELLVVKRCKMCFVLAIGHGEKRGDVVDSLFKTANSLTDIGY